MYENTKIFKHRQPVLQDEVNTSIFVPLQKDDLYGDEFQLEELPARALGSGYYKICAIPLLVHDINLGDIIETDADLLYRKTITDSGRFGFRLALNIPESHNDKPVIEFERVINILKEKDCNVEFYSHVLLAVDVENQKKARKLSGDLEKMVKDGWLIAYDTIMS